MEVAWYGGPILNLKNLALVLHLRQEMSKATCAFLKAT